MSINVARHAAYLLALATVLCALYGLVVSGCAVPPPGGADESTDCPPCDDDDAIPEPIGCSYTDWWESQASGVLPDGSGTLDLYYLTDRVPALDPAPVLIEAWITQGEGCTIGDLVQVGEDGIEFSLRLECEDALTYVGYQVTLWTCQDYIEGVRPGIMGYGG